MKCQTCDRFTSIKRQVKDEHGLLTYISICSDCQQKERMIFETDLRIVTDGPHAGKRVRMTGRKDRFTVFITFEDGGKEYKFNSSYLRLPKIDEI